MDTDELGRLLVPPERWHDIRAGDTVADGAEFVQTQFCMDIEVVRRYVARLAEYRLTDRIALLIGVTVKDLFFS